VKYEFIKKQRKHYGITKLAQVLCVSRSGYYKWLKRRISSRIIAERKMLKKIEEIFEKNRGTYGYRRIVISLRRQGIICNHKRVMRIMREQGLIAVQRRKYKAMTTNSKGNNRISPNLLKEIQASYPGEILASDITYIPLKEGWLYLSVVMDIYTREILGYSTSKHPDADLVCESLRKALQKIEINKVRIFHSDQGKQYSSNKVRKILSLYGIAQSMSRRGNCYDNAFVESFFHTLKTEWLNKFKNTTKEKTELKIFDYIETFYNKNRFHSALNYYSPMEFREKFAGGYYVY